MNVCKLLMTKLRIEKVRRLMDHSSKNQTCNNKDVYERVKEEVSRKRESGRIKPSLRVQLLLSF
ncbi:hypothetical protein JPSP1_24340 [Staphylococcus pseudintermedius]